MKWVRYLIIAIAPIILAVGVWMSIGKDSPLPDAIVVGDIVTGEVKAIDRSKLVALPAKNDRDGKRTLYPIYKAEDGSYVLHERVRDAIGKMKPEERPKVELPSYRFVSG